MEGDHSASSARRDGFDVNPDHIRDYAATVRSIHARFDRLRKSMETARPADGRFGLLLHWVQPEFEKHQLEILDTTHSAEHVLNTHVEALISTADLYQTTDLGSANEFDKLDPQGRQGGDQTEKRLPG